VESNLYSFTAYSLIIFWKRAGEEGNVPTLIPVGIHHFLVTLFLRGFTRTSLELWRLFYENTTRKVFYKYIHSVFIPNGIARIHRS
jgi:hypothetical protein